MRPSRWLLFCIVGLLQLVAGRGYAQDMHSVLARDRALAERPLTGPRAAVGVGATLIIAAPVILTLGVLATFDLGDCPGLFSDETDVDCSEERLQERHDEQVMNRVIGASVSSGLVGAGLLAFGVTRIIQVRRARRRVARFEHLALSPSARGAALSLRFRF